MQLPWPFRRAQRSPSADGDARSEHAEPGPRPRPRDAWRELARLVETIGPPPLIAPPRPFADGLAANNPPPPILAPLSHGRGIDAPSGLVVGIARPVVAPAGPALPRPAQRAAIGGSRPAIEPRPAEASAEDSADAFWPAVAESPRDVAVRPAPGPAGVSPDGSSRGQLEVAIPLIRRSMTLAPEPNQRSPIVGLIGQPRASGARQPGLSLPTASAVQRAPAPIAPLPAAPVPAGPIPADPIPIAPRLTIGQARRLGLGAPLLVPMGRTSQPGEARGPLGLASSMPVTLTGRETPNATAGESAERPDRAELPLATPPLATPPLATPPPPTPPASPVVQGSAPPENPDSASPAVPRSRPIAPPARTAAPAGRARAAASPILSARPLRAAVQRAPLTLPPSPAGSARSGSEGSRAGTTAGSAPVRIHRGGEAGDLAAALDARSFTHGGEIYLPAGVGPLTSGEGRSLLAHEMTHVAQQQRLAGRLPGEDSAHGRTLEAEAVAAERAPDLVLATRSTARNPDDTQREAVHTSSLTTPADGTNGTQAMAQRAPAGGAAGNRQEAGRGSKDHTHTEQELEVLAHQLYQRIGRHLRRELLVDRERAGLALDLP